MKVFAAVIVVVSLAEVLTLTGCGSAEAQTPVPGDKPSLAVIERQNDLRNAIANLNAKRADRDAAVVDRISVEDRARKGEAQIAAVVDEASEVGRVIDSWGDDYVASITDITPTSIEKIVRESTSFMTRLKGREVDDAPSSYLNAFNRYVDACGHIADAETMRLKIINTHLGLLMENVTIWCDPDEALFAGITIGDWIKQGSEVNDLIRKGVDDLKTAKSALTLEQDTATQTFSTDIATATARVVLQNQAVSEAEDRLKALGGQP